MILHVQFEWSGKVVYAKTTLRVLQETRNFLITIKFILFLKVFDGLYL